MQGLWWKRPPPLLPTHYPITSFSLGGHSRLAKEVFQAAPKPRPSLPPALPSPEQPHWAWTCPSCSCHPVVSQRLANTLSQPPPGSDPQFQHRRQAPTVIPGSCWALSCRAGRNPSNPFLRSFPVVKLSPQEQGSDLHKTPWQLLL